MKFTLAWLKEHLKTTATVDQIATTLSAIGLEVESVEDPGAKLGAFTVARIVEAKKHPNADKLTLLTQYAGLIDFSTVNQLRHILNNLAPAEIAHHIESHTPLR